MASYFQAQQGNGSDQSGNIQGNWLYLPPNRPLHDPPNNETLGVVKCDTQYSRSNQYTNYLYCDTNFTLLTYAAYQTESGTGSSNITVEFEPPPELTLEQKEEIGGTILWVLSVAFTFRVLRKFISNEH